MAIRYVLLGLAGAATVSASAGVASAAGPAVVLFAAGDAVPEEVMVELRADLDAPLAEAGYDPAAPDALRKPAPDPWAKETGRCLSDLACSERLQGELNVVAIVCVELQAGEVGGEYVARVTAQQGAIRTSRINVMPGTGEQIAEDLVKAVRWALESVKKRASQAQLQRKTMMRPRAEPSKPPRPVPPAAASAPTDVAEAAPASGAKPAAAPTGTSGAQPAATTAQRWTYKEPEPERPLVGIEFGAWGGLQPIRHNRTNLLVGDRIRKSRLGEPAAGFSVDFRLPVDGVYETNRFTYAFAAPISVLAFDVGFENRWEGGTVVPLTGAGVWLALLGLPVVDPDGAEQTGRALVLGAQAYGGVAFFPHERVGVHIRAGFRFSPKKANQFDAGGQTYYALDAHGANWELSLSGPMAEAGVTFEL